MIDLSKYSSRKRNFRTRFEMKTVGERERQMTQEDFTIQILFSSPFVLLFVWSRVRSVFVLYQIVLVFSIWIQLQHFGTICCAISSEQWKSLKI